MKLIRTLRKLIINSLGFSKTEANGFLLLLLTTVLLAIVPRIYFSSFETSVYQPSGELSAWADELNNSIEEKKATILENTKTVTFSAFDPNRSTVDEMTAAGVPELIAKRIALYREKGGRFYQPKDIRKIYGLKADLAEQLIPFVRIEKGASPIESTASRFEKYEPRAETEYSFELNTTVAEELQLIKGIGLVLSDRIIKYRERLGGFHSYDQLTEIYGLKPEVIDEIRKHTTLTETIRPLDINNDSLKVLIRHPYLSYDLARIMINYRKVHGNFERPEDLRKIKILSDSLYQKLYPYLPK